MILILSNVKETLGRRKWQFTPVFLPGTSHGKRSLACYRPGGCEELDMTERQHTEKLGGKNLDVTRRFFAIRLKLKWAQTEKDDFINILLSPYRIIYCTLSSTFIIEHLFFFLTNAHSVQIWAPTTLSLDRKFLRKESFHKQHLRILLRVYKLIIKQSETPRCSLEHLFLRCMVSAL